MKLLAINIGKYLHELFFETTWIKILFAATVSFIEPISSRMAWVFVLFLLDLITGIRASSKEGIPFSSKRFRIGIDKIIAYVIALVAVYILEAYIFRMESEYLFIGVISFIGVTEVTSMYENLDRISGLKLKAKITELLKKSSK